MMSCIVSLTSWCVSITIGWWFDRSWWRSNCHAGADAQTITCSDWDHTRGAYLLMSIKWIAQIICSSIWYFCLLRCCLLFSLRHVLDVHSLSVVANVPTSPADLTVSLQMLWWMLCITACLKITDLDVLRFISQENSKIAATTTSVRMPNAFSPTFAASTNLRWGEI